MQADSFATRGFCPESTPGCLVPDTLSAISPVDIPDKLSQASVSLGGPIARDKTFFFLTADYTRQDRTTFLSPTLPSFLLPADGHLDYTGHYRQTLLDGRLDHKLTSNQNLMFRMNVDRFYDDNPQDAVGGTSAPSVARRYSRRSWTAQVNHTWVLSTSLLNEARFRMIEQQDPDFSKVLVRYNPDDPDVDMNRRQLDRLKRLSDWLHEHDRKFLFELLVPATDDQLAREDGDTDRYDAELRPELMRRAIEDIQGAGIEVDIWKIEGVDERSDAEMLAEQTRAGGRDRVTCVLLGRGASDEKVDHWLSQAAPVDGFIGFAIGRSIWGGPLKAFLDGSVERDVAAREIGGNYLRFINVYDDSEAAVAGR